jgi:hypothetical protein
LTGDNVVLLDPRNDPIIVEMTYSAQWYRVPIKYNERKSASINLFPVKKSAASMIEWPGLLKWIASLLVGAAFLSLKLVHLLKKDFIRFKDIENPVLDKSLFFLTLQEFTEEKGWKEITHDVFRLPPYPLFFSALIGVGIQILVVGGTLILLGLAGLYSPGEIEVMVSTFVVYALTSFLSGFTSSFFYTKFSGFLSSSFPLKVR